MVENAKIKKFNCHILSNFQTKCFCSSVKRHLLSNATQWLKILKKVSFSNSLNFSSLSQNELFWRVEFEYNETFLGWFSNTVCWLFKLSRHSQISAQLPKNLSLNVFISQPFMAKYFYSCLAMLLFDVFIRIAKWQWSKPSQQHPNRGGKTKYVIITMPKKKMKFIPHYYKNEEKYSYLLEFFQKLMKTA